MKTRGKGQETLSTAERALQEKFKTIKQRRALQVRFYVPPHDRHRYVSQIFSSLRSMLLFRTRRIIDILLCCRLIEKGEPRSVKMLIDWPII